MDFEFQGMRYRILYRPHSRRLETWYKPVDADHWRQDGSKEVPLGMSVKVASEVVRRYITGEMDQDTYEATLPGK